MISLIFILLHFIKRNRLDRSLYRNSQIIQSEYHNDFKKIYHAIKRRRLGRILQIFYDKILKLVYDNKQPLEIVAHYLRSDLDKESVKYKKALSVFVGIGRASLYISIVAILCCLTVIVLALWSSEPHVLSDISALMTISVYGICLTIAAYLAHSKFLTQSQHQLQLLQRQADYLIDSLQRSAQNLYNEELL
jgi:hypothetical protein